MDSGHYLWLTVNYSTPTKVVAFSRSLPTNPLKAGAHIYSVVKLSMSTAQLLAVNDPYDRWLN